MAITLLKRRILSCGFNPHPRCRLLPVSHLRRLAIKVAVILSLVVTLCLFLRLNSQRTTGTNSELLPKTKGGSIRRSTSPLRASYQCPVGNVSVVKDQPSRKQEQFPTLESTDRKVLVLVETLYSRTAKQIADTFDALKFSYKMEPLGKSLPLLTTLTRGRFSLIVIENYYKYVNLDEWNRQLLDKYCTEYAVAIVAWMRSRDDIAYSRAKVKGFPLHILQHQRASSGFWNADSPLLHVARAGPQFQFSEAGGKADDQWLTFSSEHDTYEPVLYVQSGEEACAAVVYDRGGFDGVRRVLFGYGLQFWMVQVAFVDAVRWLTGGRLSLPLTRHLQVDIDDVFVGPTGSRMVADDVRALVDSQERIRTMVPDFVFYLGFSGKYFESGSDDENEADRLLVEKCSHFRWFPHMWRHNQAHQYDEAALAALMLRNRNFAEEHSLNVSWQYAVAPHHAGVYPVHTALYDVWRRVYDIRVTTTEEYPHLKPASQRRGFIHRGIMVLPRQTCGIYTRNTFADEYPGGFNVLQGSIFGGELFSTFLLNPYLLFMTHSTNYGSDRLAPYLFESALRFVQCWTNLDVRAGTPMHVARSYFNAYRQERRPIWTNPCMDKRHLEIWAPEKNCVNTLPQALIIGPQKTGTTALYTFLKLHPSVLTSRPNNDTFEEVQFFGHRNYENGIDWYMDFFTPAANETQAATDEVSDRLLFEKSAGYFDASSAPLQAHTLLPTARIIVVLTSPAARAYSWYQHMRAKGDEMALANTFEEVLSEKSGSVAIRKLRHRSLNPGKYATHLEKWLELYGNKQMLIVDGDQLKNDPVTVMLAVQQFLGLEPQIDYSSHLVFDDRKGFFCYLQPNATSSTPASAKRRRCLGRSKGRRYAPMSDATRRHLLLFYRPHNIALHRLLTKYAYATPGWLRAELAETITDRPPGN